MGDRGRTSASLIFFMLHSLTHVRAAFEALGGLPIPAIHISGSKGKGTTAFLLAKIIELSGDRVGLFSSPAIMDETEMIQVNSCRIPSDRLFALKEKIAVLDPSLTEFELQTLAAFEYFKEENCDFVVLECGWGGREDATNVIENKALTLVTHIELEHADVLGPTLTDIVKHKLGIHRAGVPLLTPVQQCSELFEELNCMGISPLLSPQMALGFHHPESAGLAVMAAELLGYSLDSVIEKALVECVIPGRFEILPFGPHTLILDGAHTYDSVKFVLERVLDYQREKGLPDPYFGVHFLRDKNPELPDLFPLHRTFWIPLEDERAGKKPDPLQEMPLPEILERLKNTALPELWLFVGSFKLVAKVKDLQASLPDGFFRS